MCCSKRDLVIFFLGAQLFHTLSHIMLAVAGVLPLHVFSWTITPQMNLIIILINILVTVGLGYWLYRIDR
jgi:hypothetical protein